MKKLLSFLVVLIPSIVLSAGASYTNYDSLNKNSVVVTNVSFSSLLESTNGAPVGYMFAAGGTNSDGSFFGAFVPAPAAGLDGYGVTQIVNGLAYPLTGNPSGFVDQTVTNGLLGVAGNGSALTGITAAQVGALSTNGGTMSGSANVSFPKGTNTYSTGISRAGVTIVDQADNSVTGFNSHHFFVDQIFNPGFIADYGLLGVMWPGNSPTLPSYMGQNLTNAASQIICSNGVGAVYAFPGDASGFRTLATTDRTATAAQGAEADTAVQRTGDTNVITLASAAEVSVPNPVNMMDAANYGTVLGLFSGGDFYYNSGYTSAVNTAYFAFQQSIPPPGSRVYSITGASVGTYVGQVMTTNKFLEVFGQVSVNCYMHCTSGNADIIAEIYYSYDGTNWVGDFASQSQNIASSTATNLYQWNLTFPTIVATNTTGFYVARKFKVAAQSGSPTLTIFFGTNSANGTASHISFPVQPLSLGDRGATNVINASGLAGTYDAASRTATIATDTIYATQSQATNISQGVVSAFATTGTVANAGNAATVTTLTGSQIAAAGGLTNPASFDISGTAVSVAAGYLPLAGGTMTNGIYFSPAPSTACILLPVDPAFLGPNRPSCSFASLEKDNNHIVTNIFLVTGLGLEWFSGLTLSWLDVLDSANYATYITQPSTNAANIAALSNTTMTINGTVMKIGTNNAITVIGGSGISGDTATNIADSRIAAWAPTGTVANAGNAATVTTITGAQIAVAGGLTNPASFDISGTAVSVAAGYLPLAGGTMTNGIYFSPAPSTACILLPVDPAFLGPNRPSCSFASLEKDNNHIVTNIFLVTGLGLEWFSGLTLSWLDVLDSANYATYITQPSTNAANIAALSNTTMTINGTVMKIGTNNAITVIGGSGISGDTATNIADSRIAAWAPTGTVANAGNAATVTTITGAQIAVAGGLTNPASFDISGTAVSVAAGYLPLAGGTMTNGIYFSPAPSTACILLPVDPAFLGPNRPSCSFASLEKDNNHIVTNIFLVTGLGLEWFSGLTLSWLDVLDSANYATYITQPSTNAANIAALSNTTMTINGTVMKIGTNNAITVIGGSGISGDTATNIADSRIAAWAPTGTVANAGNAATVTTITGAQIAVAGGLTNPAAFATAAQGALVADATLGNTGLYNQVQVALTNYIAADTISRTNYVAANTIAMTNLQAIITAGDNIANTNGMAYTIASTNGIITGYATWGIIGGVLITNNTVYLGTITGAPSIAALGTTNFLFTAGGNSARFGF